jgi:hypothetical protein
VSPLWGFYRFIYGKVLNEKRAEQFDGDVTTLSLEGCKRWDKNKYKLNFVIYMQPSCIFAFAEIVKSPDIFYSYMKMHYFKSLSIVEDM